MATIDDVNRLAAQDVVYFTRNFNGYTVEVFRGRLRQSLSGTWVFNSSTGQNGAVGFMLGFVGQNWTSSESPQTGIVINISNQIFSAQNVGAVFEYIVLRNVIPPEFSE